MHCDAQTVCFDIRTLLQHHPLSIACLAQSSVAVVVFLHLRCTGREELRVHVHHLLQHTECDGDHLLVPVLFCVGVECHEEDRKCCLLRLRHKLHHILRRHDLQRTLSHLEVCGLDALSDLAEEHISDGADVIHEHTVDDVFELREKENLLC